MNFKTIHTLKIIETVNYIETVKIIETLEINANIETVRKQRKNFETVKGDVDRLRNRHGVLAMPSILESIVQKTLEVNTIERQNESQTSLKLISSRSRVLKNVSQLHHILDFGESTSPLRMSGLLTI